MLTLYAIASKFVLPYMIIILAHKRLRKHPFLLALRRRGRFVRRNVCDSAAEFHTDDANQCLHNKSSSHGVPNTNLSDFTCLLVDFVFICQRAATKLKCLFLRILYSTNIDCFVRDSSHLHLTFVAFCLLSVIRKQ